MQEGGARAVTNAASTVTEHVDRLEGTAADPFGLDLAFRDTVAPVFEFLHDVYEKTGRTGTMVFVVVRYTLSNQRGEQVAIVDNRFMYRGGGQ